jgi:hypothetical protein
MDRGSHGTVSRLLLIPSKPDEGDFAFVRLSGRSTTHNQEDKMKLKRVAIAIAAAGAIATQAAAGGTCDEYFRISSITQDRDGNTTYRVSVSAYALENPTDSVIVELGRCYAALISTSPGMGMVEDDAGRQIDITAAIEMSNF